jgi:hypothetical protein
MRALRLTTFGLPLARHDPAATVRRGDANELDEQRQPAAPLDDGSIRDRAAVSPGLARLLLSDTGSHAARQRRYPRQHECGCRPGLHERRARRHEQGSGRAGRPTRTALVLGASAAAEQALPRGKGKAAPRSRCLPHRSIPSADAGLLLSRTATANRERREVRLATRADCCNARRTQQPDDRDEIAGARSTHQSARCRRGCWFPI